MKYVVLGLILILGFIGRPAGIAGQPMTYDGVARFDQQRADGVVTLVSIHLQVREETTVLALSISRFQQSCGQDSACGTKALFTGSATQRIADGDADVDRHLAWASLHTDLSIFDAVSSEREEIALDVQWTATGELAPTPHGISEALSRDATASGVVTGPSLGTVSLASTTPGTLSRHLDA